MPLVALARLHRTRCLFALAAACLCSGGAHAIGCEELRTSILQKLARAGAPKATIAIVDASQPGPGRVIGSCDTGTKKLLHTTEASGTPAAPRKMPRKDDEVLVECFDGQRYTDGPCRR